MTLVLNLIGIVILILIFGWLTGYSERAGRAAYERDMG